MTLKRFVRHRDPDSLRFSALLTRFFWYVSSVKSREIPWQDLQDTLAAREQAKQAQAEAGRCWKSWKRYPDFKEINKTP